MRIAHFVLFLNALCGVHYAFATPCESSSQGEVLTRITFQSQLRRYELSGFFAYTMASDSDFPTKYRTEAWSGTSTGCYYACGCHSQNTNMVHSGAWTFSAVDFTNVSTKTATWKNDGCGASPNPTTQTGIKDGLKSTPTNWGPPITSQTSTVRIADYSQPDPVPPHYISGCDFTWRYWNSYVTDALSDPMTVEEAVARGDAAAPISTGTDSVQYWNDFSPKTWGAAKTLSRTQSITFNAQHVGFRVELPAKPCGGKYRLVLKLKDWAYGEAEPANPTKTVAYPELIELDKKLPTLWPSATTFATYAQFGLPPVQGRRSKLVSIELQSAEVCQSLPAGHGTFSLGSVDFQLSLGRINGDTPAGILSLNSPVINSSLFTPAALIPTTDASVTVLREDAVVRQVSAPEVFIDVVTLSGTSYELRAYRPSQAGTPDPATGLFPLTGAPFQSYTFAGNGTDELTITPSDVPVRAATYVYDSGTGTMTMSQLAADRIESTTKVTSGSTTTETRTIKNNAGDLVAQETRVYTTYAFGRVLTSLTLGAGTDARTTTTSYYTTTSDTANYGRIQQITEPSGAWVRRTYNSQGRVLTETRRYLNNSGTTGSSHRVNTYTYGTVADQDGDGTAEELITRVSTTLNVETGRTYELNYSGVETYDGFPTRRSLSIVALAPGAVWNAAGNLVTTTRVVASGPHVGKTVYTLSPESILSTTGYVTDLGTNQITITTATGAPDVGLSSVIAGTRTVTTTDALGRTLDHTVVDIATGTVLEAYVVTETDADGRATRIDYTDGTHIARSYSCCGLGSETDRNGLTTTYLYDALGRTEYVIGQGLTTRYVHDAAGRIRKTYRRGSDNTEILVEEADYNTAGSLTLSKDALGRPATYQESLVSGGGLLSVTTMPDTGTVRQTTAADGSLLKIEGTATPWKTYAYAVNTGGTFSTTEYLPAVLITETTAWRRTIIDFAGRLKTEEFPGSAANQYFYNGLGQLARQTDPDGVQILYAYNNLGERSVTALDIDRNGTIDYAGTDRITRTTREVADRSEGSASIPVQRVTTEVWLANGDDTPREVSVTDVSLDGMTTWQTTNGLTSKSVTVVDPANQTRTETVTYPDQTMQIATYEDGRLQTSVRKDSAGGTVTGSTYGYDPHGRLSTVTDSLGRVTTTTYYDDDQVHTVTTPDPDTTRSGPGYDPQTTTYTYDDAGRVWKVEEPDGATTETTYWATGKVKRVSGGRTYPQAYTYDAQARLKTLTTWKDYAGEMGAAITTWNYHSQRGWLANKRHNDNKGPNYEYTAAGRLWKRTWARTIGGAPLLTTYGYNNAGELWTITYSDGTTPNVTHTYDRVGRPSTTTDAAGLLTRDYDPASLGLSGESYTGSGHLSGRSLTRTYDVVQRAQGLATDGGYGLDYGYDNAGRFKTVSEGNHSATLGYETGTSYHDQTTIKRVGVERVRHVRDIDGLGRIGSVSSVMGGIAAVARTYEYNDANQRVGVAIEDGRRWAYGYDDLGQVTSAQKRLADDVTPLPGYTFGYAFDDIGNRTGTTVNGRSASYASDLLNRYSSRVVPGAVDVRGEAHVDATVTVDTLATIRTDGDFYRELTLANGSAAVSQDIEIEAVRLTPPQSASEIRTVFLPQTPEGFTHDDDGNLKQDGRWDYRWDAENRLVGMETRVGIATAFPALKQRLTFAYDAHGRRIRKTVENWDALLNAGAGGWVETLDLLFLYDGWNLLTELDANNGNALVRSHAWGLDLSGSLQGAGGVGGLLWTSTPTHTFAPCHDGNGNVTAWVDTATIVVSGRADYGAFGEIVMRTGVAGNLPFGFSTKYTDGEGGLLYYGFRYYNSGTGRWLSRDPIGERGGLNLYGMVNNVPTGFFDILGLVLQRYPSALYQAQCQKWRATYHEALNNYPDNLEKYLRAIRDEKDIAAAFDKYIFGQRNFGNPGTHTFDIDLEIKGVVEKLISTHGNPNTDLGAFNVVLGKLNNTLKVIQIIEKFSSEGASAGAGSVSTEANKLVAEAMLRQVEKLAIGGTKVTSAIMAIEGIRSTGYAIADAYTLREQLVSGPQNLQNQYLIAMRNNLQDAERARKLWFLGDCHCYENLD